MRGFVTSDTILLRILAGFTTSTAPPLREATHPSGSMIQKKQDDDGKMRGVYHGIGGRDGKNVWKDPRVGSICLLCGDRKQLKTNCVSRTLLKAPATQPPRPTDALRDPTLEVARVKCVYQDCASHLKPAPNLVVLDRASDDSLNRRYTCLACKRQWE